MGRTPGLPSSEPSLDPRVVPDLASRATSLLSPGTLPQLPVWASSCLPLSPTPRTNPRDPGVEATLGCLHPTQGPEKGVSRGHTQLLEPQPGTSQVTEVPFEPRFPLGNARLDVASPRKGDSPVVLSGVGPTPSSIVLGTGWDPRSQEGCVTGAGDKRPGWSHAPSLSSGLSGTWGDKACVPLISAPLDLPYRADGHHGAGSSALREAFGL